MRFEAMCVLHSELKKSWGQIDKFCHKTNKQMNYFARIRMSIVFF